MPDVVKIAKPKQTAVNDAHVVTDQDHEEYLRLEAERRQVPIAVVCAEEEAARLENELKSPSIERLRRLAASSSTPEKYWQHDEEQKPF